jgi:hypothetical protein
VLQEFKQVRLKLALVGNSDDRLEQLNAPKIVRDSMADVVGRLDYR